MREHAQATALRREGGLRCHVHLPLPGRGLLPSIVSAQRTRVCCSMSRADVQSRPSDVFLSSGFASYGYIAESQQSA